jgi:hypothetical protein
MVPPAASLTDHFTALLLVPSIEAVKLSALPAATVTAVGETLTVTDCPDFKAESLELCPPAHAKRMVLASPSRLHLLNVLISLLRREGLRRGPTVPRRTVDPSVPTTTIGVSRHHGTPSPADRVLKQGTVVRKQSTPFAQPGRLGWLASMSR